MIRKQLKNLPIAFIVFLPYSGYSSTIDGLDFTKKLKDKLPYSSSIIKDFFYNIFFCNKAGLHIDSIESKILTDSDFKLLYLSKPIFHENKCVPDLLYSMKTGGSSFNRIANCILGYKGPTLFIIEHMQNNDLENFGKDQTYILGAFTNCPWEDDLQYFGDSSAFLYALHPTFNIFRSYTKENSNYMYLNTRKIEKSKYKTGMGFGGDHNNDYRLWLDDDLEMKSYIRHEDSTFDIGTLAGFHIEKLNIQNIEIWGYGGQDALDAREEYRKSEAQRFAFFLSRIEKCRKVDKKAFLGDFDKEMFFGLFLLMKAKHLHTKSNVETLVILKSRENKNND